jgi:hypothetical protein
MSDNARPSGEARRPWLSARWQIAALVALGGVGTVLSLTQARAHVVRNSPLRWLFPSAEPVAEAAPETQPEPPPPVTRPRSLDEAALTGQLLAASREVDLEASKKEKDDFWQASVAYHTQVNRRPFAEQRRTSLTRPVEDLLAARQDLRGLPLLLGGACETDWDDVKVIARVCDDLRAAQRGRTPAQNSAALRQWLISQENGIADRRTASARVRALEQAVQVEDAAVRRELVNALSKAPGAEATRALARRAVFDPCPSVRTTAVEALRSRDRAVARPVFLEALRHPWPAAADHAALALVDLRDADAAPELRELLKRQDPCAPRQENGVWRQRRLVRVNHLRNCMLCHPPSISIEDVSVGPVPTPGEPLPPPDQYAGRARFRRGAQLVRADVTYFRQDFSLMHRVEKPGKWPTVQRFDYFVQTSDLDRGAV